MNPAGRRRSGVSLPRAPHLGSRGPSARYDPRPAPSVLWVLLSCLFCFCLVSCSPGQTVQIVTPHEYVLLCTQNASPTVLADDDPLYTEFQEQVLSDPYLATLISLFENTTTAYASSNRAAPVATTVANHLMIVLDTADVGPLPDLRARYSESNFSVELALGLGNQSRVDLAWAQDHMAQAMGPLLLGLAGLPAVAGQAAPHEATTPDAALYHGFGLALEAIDGQDPATQSRWRARGQDSRAILAQQDRVHQVRDNGYLFRYENDEPTLQLRSREQAMRTPGVVAAFFTRLLERSGVYYPQCHLLWFFSYPPDQVPYAKVLLALDDMATGEQISVQGFIDSYSELFPADRKMVLALADEVFGSAA
jgi:hypothetical protein